RSLSIISHLFRLVKWFQKIFSNSFPLLFSLDVRRLSAFAFGQLLYYNTLILFCQAFFELFLQLCAKLSTHPVYMALFIFTLHNARAFLRHFN
ncbi:MAG: hypothetical protein ACI4KA_09935, partial [Oscillospiraceae bacterium]